MRGDRDQLDQLLINLLRNAVDASLETGGGVTVGWTRVGTQLEVVIDDEGHGPFEYGESCSCRFSRPSQEGRGSGWC